VAPVVLQSQLDDQLLDCLISWRATDFVFLLIGPFPPHQLSVPAKDCFWLKESNETFELLYRPFRLLSQTGGQYRKGQLFSPIGLNWFVLFTLQDPQLLSQDEDFQVFVSFGCATKTKQGENHGEQLRNDKPDHAKSYSKWDGA
jgi:hypothetical protein